VHDGQDGVNCRVTQSKAAETDPRFVREVWSGDLHLPPGRPANQEIQVTFSYNENGIMQCAFVDVETGRRTDVDLHVASASDEEDHVIDQFTVE
jgi:molecular chaperone DnaK